MMNFNKVNVKKNIRNHLTNSRGWSTNRKIVVFESDDWGSIRTPSLSVLTKLRKDGYAVESCNYMLNDALESESDLTNLFEVLSSRKDINGNSSKFTANTIVANPDFKKIQDSNFQEYFFEPFIETYKRYPSHSESFDVFTEGIRENIFKPQLHGREHLNISRWMNDLKSNVPETHDTFKLEMFGLSAHISKIKRGSYQAAFDGGVKELTYNHNEILFDACQLFEKIFSHKSKSFISPNYIWNDAIEKCLSNFGVDYIQGSSTQKISKDYSEKLQVKRHYTGQKNNFHQTYLVRNCSFEPSLENRQHVADCLSQISNAFFWGKPAIISSHRVNYIGFLNPKNADKSLKILNELLLAIIKKWPTVEFMFSDELGDLINNPKV